ncbi:hypothetical protein CEXT_34261 [Caerostris extrusa]|uniref:Uncharacterized protein n=1 Tax=Caerostris extrusa TaxID=172846 RepID=A0AAV4PIU7_CAEEX|nr:hypothetical protein CEXT_34261 [Caerostris extrusa]
MRTSMTLLRIAPPFPANLPAQSNPHSFTQVLRAKKKKKKKKQKQTIKQKPNDKAVSPRVRGNLASVRRLVPASLIRTCSRRSGTGRKSSAKQGRCANDKWS